MTEYIDKNAVLHEMKMDIRPPFAVVRDFPASDVAPVVHGKWLNFYGDFTCAECSECGAIYDVVTNEKSNEEIFREFAKDYKYCPNCGAKMDLEG